MAPAAGFAAYSAAPSRVRQALPVARAGRERVLAQHPVQDRVVHVELRVVVPARMLGERRDHPFVCVGEPARTLHVIAGPAVPRLPLQVLQHGLVAGHDGVPHSLRPRRPFLRFASPTSVTRLLRPDLQRCMQPARRDAAPADSRGVAPAENLIHAGESRCMGEARPSHDWYRSIICRRFRPRGSSGPGRGLPELRSFLRSERSRSQFSSSPSSCEWPPLASWPLHPCQWDCFPTTSGR